MHELKEELDVKLARYETARTHLTLAVKYLLGETKYLTAKKTTNNYDKFLEEYKNAGILVVSREGCNRTIYRSAKINRDARAWHDMVHISHGLSFNLNDEKKVALAQKRQVISFLRRIGIDNQIAEDAGELIFIDIAFQAEFYHLNGRFLHNQEAFVLEYLLSWLDKEESKDL